jgi:hypothetical protein
MRKIHTRIGARSVRRSRAQAAAVAVLAAVLLSAAPGIASADTGTVTPLLDCYTPNSDGSYTVILGYTNTDTTTRAIPYGSLNYTTPSTYQSLMPTQFQPGTRHAAFSVQVAPADLNSTSSWSLDGHTLNYLSAASASGICSASTSLPATGNGTGLAIALLAGGVVGVVGLHRATRRRAATVAAARPAADD